MQSIDDLSKLILDELTQYTDQVDEKMQNEIDKLAKEVRDDLANNPNVPERTGKYKKGFYIKKEAAGKGYKRVRVANKEYQRTHLLQYGHALRNGGRARAFPHWDEAQEIADTLSERIIKVIQK